MFTKSLVFGALLLAASASQAKSNILAVSGTIGVTACTLSLSGGGVANFGALTAHDVQTAPVTDDLGVSRYVVGITKTVTMTVLCPTAAKVALSFVDNRATSASPSAAVNIYRLGLGTYTVPGGVAANIGSYYLYAPTINVKATAAAVAAAPASRLYTAGAASSTSIWHKAADSETNYIAVGNSLGFATTATSTTPDSLVSIVGDLDMRIELLTATVNSATTTITLDGSTTVTLVTL